ncbi:hypothetical protein MMC07_005988 [Pseudocyphellaria aurata]|nr:hypothetical protein [Pseudocyphellaria aurata]
MSRTSVHEEIRYFGLGTRIAVSHSSAEKIRRQGGGYAEFVGVESNGRWESGVVYTFNEALTPSSRECKISLKHEFKPFVNQIDEDMRISPGELPHVEVQKPVCVQAPFRSPTLHTFSPPSDFFMIDRKIFLKDFIKNQAVAFGGKTHTIYLPQKGTELKVATIHYPVTKALMDDFEAEHRWLHSKYKTLKDVRPIASEERV